MCGVTISSGLPCSLGAKRPLPLPGRPFHSIAFSRSVLEGDLFHQDGENESFELADRMLPFFPSRSELHLLHPWNGNQTTVVLSPWTQD